MLKGLCRTVICALLAGARSFLGAPAIAADAAFQKWLEGTWPQARALGVARGTFDAATRGLDPDLTLPDLVIPGRASRPASPNSSARRPSISRDDVRAARSAGAARVDGASPQRFLAIEERFGVPPAVLIAI